MDETQVRRNDYATISAALSALLVPAVFLNRARLPTLVLGGGSIGLGLGATAFVVERLTKGQDTGVNVSFQELNDIRAVRQTDCRCCLDAWRREGSVGQGDYANRCILKGKGVWAGTWGHKHKTCECHSMGFTYTTLHLKSNLHPGSTANRL